MHALRNRVGAEGIVYLRNFKLVPAERRMLLYTEFCPLGDLRQFTGWYDEEVKEVEGAGEEEGEEEEE